mmetsp:Transcript_18168/g.43695  ORF Transcript_18168/g.43695 Transcript_18168/m.43695 type:complete len:212 (-) Transcript_18168:295-930(-)
MNAASETRYAPSSPVPIRSTYARAESTSSPLETRTTTNKCPSGACEGAASISARSYPSRPSSISVTPPSREWSRIERSSVPSSRRGRSVAHETYPSLTLAPPPTPSPSTPPAERDTLHSFNTSDELSDRARAEGGAAVEILCCLRGGGLLLDGVLTGLLPGAVRSEPSSFDVDGGSRTNATMSSPSSEASIPSSKTAEFSTDVALLEGVVK